MMILLLLLLLLVMMRLLFLFFLPTRNLCKMYFDADEKTKIELKRLIKHESLKGNRWGQLRLQVKMRQQSCLRQTHINPNPQLSVSYIICSKGFLFLFNHRALSSSILLSFTENFHLFFFSTPDFIATLIPFERPFSFIVFRSHPLSMPSAFGGVLDNLYFHLLCFHKFLSFFFFLYHLKINLVFIFFCRLSSAFHFSSFSLTMSFFHSWYFTFSFEVF